MSEQDIVVSGRTPIPCDQVERNKSADHTDTAFGVGEPCLQQAPDPWQSPHEMFGRWALASPTNIVPKGVESNSAMTEFDLHCGRLHLDIIGVQDSRLDWECTIHVPHYTVVTRAR